ncbi:MAG: hypothetical protein WC584_01025 [Candidatus Pacearchaeota archaeon]
MSLFRKKCEYCREKIENGKEVFREVKDPVFVGTKRKSFCCESHANKYEGEVKKAKKCGNSCCG